MIIFVGYKTTPQKLVDYLASIGIPARSVKPGKDKIIQCEEIDTVCNWGLSEIPLFKNKPARIVNAAIVSDKKEQLRLFRLAGVPCPKEPIEGKDCLVRKLKHRGGIGMKICKWPVEIMPDEYAVKWEDKLVEFRVHVIGGYACFFSRKKPINAEPAWNHVNAKQVKFGVDIFCQGLANLGVESVNALGMDFGAVDIIMNTMMEPFVLEVNSAPGLDVPEKIETYGNFVAFATKRKAEENEQHDDQEVQLQV